MPTKSSLLISLSIMLLLALLTILVGIIFALVLLGDSESGMVGIEEYPTEISTGVVDNDPMPGITEEPTMEVEASGEIIDDLRLALDTEIAALDAIVEEGMENPMYETALSAGSELRTLKAMLNENTQEDIISKLQSYDWVSSDASLMYDRVIDQSD